MNPFVRASVAATGILVLAGCSGWPGAAIAWRQTAVGVALPQSSAHGQLAALRPELEAAQAAGAAFVRIPVRPEHIVTAPAQYDWSFADGLVDLAADKLKLRLMPYVAPSAAAADGIGTVALSRAFMQRYEGRIWTWRLAEDSDPAAEDALNEPSGPGFASITDEAPDALARALVTALADSAVEAIAWEPPSSAAWSSGPGADAFAQVARWFARPYQTLQPKFEVTRGGGDTDVKVHGFRLKDGRFVVAAWLEDDAASPAEVKVRFSMPGVSDVQMTDARGVRLPAARARWGERWFAVELELALESGGVVFAEASPARP